MFGQRFMTTSTPSARARAAAASSRTPSCIPEAILNVTVIYNKIRCCPLAHSPPHTRGNHGPLLLDQKLLSAEANALLARYFQGRRLFGDLDFSAMKQAEPDTLFAAWLALNHFERA
jgi:hypothetical protein